MTPARPVIPDLPAASALGAAPTLPAASQEALRVLGEQLLADLDGMADRLTVMVLQREPAYAERDMVDELRGACRRNLERGVQVLARRVPPGVDPSELSRARSAGAGPGRACRWRRCCARTASAAG